MLLGLYRIWGGVCPCKSQAHTPSGWNRAERKPAFGLAKF